MNAIVTTAERQPKKSIDIDDLRAAIGYSARSGLIRRADDVRSGRKATGMVMARKGDVAGTVTALGYVSVSIGGMKIPAHRIAWAYTFGEWPAEEIDHINGDKTDNRLDNLRLADRSQNCRNAGIRKDNTSGFKGVTFRRSTGKWISQIAADGRRIHIGVFHSAVDAAKAYDARAAELFGPFARLNFPSNNERLAS